MPEDSDYSINFRERNRTRKVQILVLSAVWSVAAGKVLDFRVPNLRISE